MVDVASSPAELRAGLAGRPALKPYEGMLFVHPMTGFYPYTMRGMLFPLDIVWLDPSLGVVEMARGAWPDLARCGGEALSKFALEIPAGMADRYGLGIGSKLRFH